MLPALWAALALETESVGDLKLAPATPTDAAAIKTAAAAERQLDLELNNSLSSR
jgi:hypothetical protein